jgi:hypothetical protein
MIGNRRLKSDQIDEGRMGGNEACMGAESNAYSALVVRSEVTKIVSSPKNGREYNIKIVKLVIFRLETRGTE